MALFSSRTQICHFTCHAIYIMMFAYSPEDQPLPSNFGSKSLRKRREGSHEAIGISSQQSEVKVQEKAVIGDS